MTPRSDRLTDIRGRDAYAPTPTGLDPDYVWYIPALLYAVVGLDKSIIRMCEHDIGRNLNAQFVLAPHTIMRVHSGIPVLVAENDIWWSTLMGVRLDDNSDFVDYLSTMTFRNRQTDFTCSLDPTVLLDPFSVITVPTKVVVINIVTDKARGTRVAAAGHSIGIIA